MQQLDIFDVLYPNFKFGEKIRVFEAFAGIGAQIKALKRLSQKYDIEIESVGISEIDKYAIQSYMAVHGETKNYGDIAKINGKDLPQIDLFTYSFPCQDISIAGHQEGFTKGSGTRSGLLWEVERILKEIEHKPKVLLMENVKNLISEQFMDDFVEWQHELEHMGYMNYWQVLNAKDYGIPQNRERVFMVSILGEYNYNFPKSIPLELRLKDMLEDEVDEKYYLSEKLLKCFTDMTNRNGFVRGLRFTPINPDEQDYGFAITTNPGNRATDNFLVDKEGKEQITQYQGYFKDTENYIQLEEKGRLEMECRAYKEEKHSPTLHTKCNEIKIINNLRIRKLTPLECWRLMGFDDEDFRKAKDSGVSDTQLYKQAGNSIVVDVLEHIFEMMIK